MIGVALGPDRERNFTARGQQQRSAFRVKRPVTLSGHSPAAVEVAAAHVGDEFVQFAGQPFFLAQSRQVADMIDEHPAVNGHGASHGCVFRERSNHDGQVAGKQSLDRVVSRFQSLSVGLVNKGFGDQLRKSTQLRDGVGGCHVSDLLLGLKGFECVFCFGAPEEDVLLVGFHEVSDDAPTSDDAMPDRFLSSPGVG